MLPIRIDPVSRGFAESDTSYCLSSPVPKHDTSSCRSSTDRLISVIRGGTAAKGFSAGGSKSGSRLGDDSDHLVRRPAAVFPMPALDRGRQVLGGHNPRRRIPRWRPGRARAQLEHHLVVGAQIEPLEVLTGGQIPEVQRVAVLVAGRFPTAPARRRWHGRAARSHPARRHRVRHPSRRGRSPRGHSARVCGRE